MKLSDKELIQLLKAQQEPQPHTSKSEWWITGLILFFAILAFLYENAGR
jgi:hypothetical protein